MNYFDTIIVGGGHAGTEAAIISAKMGCRTLLLTKNINTIGEMSCNPSIGGIGKSHLVKEIDALGGIMGIIADKSGTQFKLLNTSKGEAVRSTRAQIDRYLYKFYIKLELFKIKNLFIIQDEVNELIVKNYKIHGVKTIKKIFFFSKNVILTTGTFLNSIIYIGNKKFIGGRINDSNLGNKLTLNLISFGLIKSRMKTGTSPRIDIKSINFNKVKIQLNEKKNIFFSIFNKNIKYSNQLPCWFTYTNINTCNIIYNNLYKSPLYNGDIKSNGPRYCPSIEEKLKKFPNNKKHIIYLEPESIYSNIIYLNGISSSLPLNIQYKFLHSIKGLENSVIIKPGYTIEYDYFLPKDLKSSLESKIINGLFLAGQINGTTGYEEAASQGIVAGINAALNIKKKSPWFPTKNNSYIGVLIDDLTTKEINEPYRMFTSRSEYRLYFREDNASNRLTPIAKKINSIDNEKWKIFCETQNIFKSSIKILKNNYFNYYFNISKKYNIYKLLYINLKYKNLFKIIIDKINKNKLLFLLKRFYNNKKLILLIINKIRNEIKYYGYIKRQIKEIYNNNNYLNLKLPYNFDYNLINELSLDSIKKLNIYKPDTIYKASCINGIDMNIIFILILYFKKNNKL